MLRICITLMRGSGSGLNSLRSGSATVHEVEGTVGINGDKWLRRLGGGGWEVAWNWFCNHCVYSLRCTVWNRALGQRQKLESKVQLSVNCKYIIFYHSFIYNNIGRCQKYLLNTFSVYINMNNNIIHFRLSCGAMHLLSSIQCIYNCKRTCTCHYLGML